jgi:hypothetical protein
MPIDRVFQVLRYLLPREQLLSIMERTLKIKIIWVFSHCKALGFRLYLNWPHTFALGAATREPLGYSGGERAALDEFRFPAHWVAHQGTGIRPGQPALWHSRQIRRI